MSTVVFIQTTEPNDVIFMIKQHRRSAPQSKLFTRPLNFVRGDKTLSFRP